MKDYARVLIFVLLVGCGSSESQPTEVGRTSVKDALKQDLPADAKAALEQQAQNEDQRIIEARKAQEAERAARGTPP